MCCCKCCQRPNNNAVAYNGGLQTIRTVNIIPPPYKSVMTTAPQYQNTAVPSTPVYQNTTAPSATQYQNTAVPSAPPPYSSVVFTIPPGDSHPCGYTSTDIIASDSNYPSNWNSLGQQRLDLQEEKGLVDTTVVNEETTEVGTLPSS